MQILQILYNICIKFQFVIAASRILFCLEITLFVNRDFLLFETIILGLLKGVRRIC